MPDVITATPAEMSFETLRKALAEPTDVVEETTEAVSEEATPATAEEAVKTTTPDPVPVESEENEPEAELPKGVQKRIQKEIDKAVRARADAERFRDELAAKLQATAPVKTPAADEKATGKPVAESFADYGDFLEALTDYKMSERDKVTAQADLKKATAAAVTAANTAWATRAELLKGKYPDFDSVMADASMSILPAMHEAILTSPLGPAIAYHLATNPAECKRIAALTPNAAVRELGKLEGKLEATPPTTTTTARKGLPKPVSVVSGAASAEVDLDTCGQRAFNRQVEKILAG